MDQSNPSMLFIDTDYRPSLACRAGSLSAAGRAGRDALLVRTICPMNQRLGQKKHRLRSDVTRSGDP
jgi:hypothetical protein